MGDWASKSVSVAIPASLVSDTPHLRERTSKVGQIGRACAIFGVRDIFVYADDPRSDQREEMEFCELILSFMETPQYLRKRIFRLSPLLKFTGILPPLQTPHHAVPSSLHNVRVGEMRDGIVIRSTAEKALVDVGLEKETECAGGLRPGTRVTVRVTQLKPTLVGEIVDQSKISISGPDMRPIYWGYHVNRAPSLGKLLQEHRFDLKIGTSRYGSPVTEVWPSLSSELKKAGSVLVAFGSPRFGLREILQQEKLDRNDVLDYFVNTIPSQKTATVRTEEALLVSLGILNLALTC